MNNDQALRKALIDYLEHPHTHAPFMDAVKNFPEKLMNEKPNNLPYSFWQLLEHIRISQFDMIDFMHNPDYKEMEWPKDYWPTDSQKATAKMWNESVKKYEKDIETLKKIIEDPKLDMLAPIPHGQGQTILREVLQIIDHASYHIGEFIVMRRLTGEWK
jgi:uncharacterized damage-inducible protein DinB